MTKTYGELFCGVGGASQGLKQAGFKGLWAIDNNQGALNIFEANHGVDYTLCMDAVNVDYPSLPEVDLLWASPNCQHYSNANPKKGETEADLLLSEAIIRAAKRANSVILENVPAYYLGNAFSLVYNSLKDQGFNYDKNIRLNAARFGNPSSRDRSYWLFSKEPFKLDFPVENKVNWFDVLSEHRCHWQMSELTAKQKEVFGKWQVIPGGIAIERCGYYRYPRIYPSQDTYPCIKAHTHHDGKNPKPGHGKVGSYRSYMDFVSNNQSYSVTPRLLGILNGFPANYLWLENKAQAAAGVGNSVAPIMSQILAKNFN